MESVNALVSKWEARLGIGTGEEAKLGVIEQAVLALTDVGVADFLDKMLLQAIAELGDVAMVGFASRESRGTFSRDGSLATLPVGLDWCFERAGRLGDLDAPFVGPTSWRYVVTSCDRGWFIAAGEDLQVRRAVSFAKMAGALWTGARDRAVTEKAATTDSLTALLNRVGLQRRIEVLPHRQQLAVLYIDLDGLKAANDAHGHAAGDALIKSTASVLLSAMRTDDIVARVGGDEFVVIALGQEPDNIMGRVRSHFKRAEIEVSIGACAVPAERQTIAEAIELADSRMYVEKKRRKAGRTA